jgi:predicted ester cyclase
MIETLVRRFFDDVLNGHNPSAAAEILLPDFVVYHPTKPNGLRGEELANLLMQFRAGFPDLHYAIIETVAEGDRVAVRWVARGTHRGEFFTIAPTQREVVVVGVDVFHALEGRLRSSWVNSDFFGLFMQLGAFPPVNAPVSASS